MHVISSKLEAECHFGNLRRFSLSATRETSEREVLSQKFIHFYSQPYLLAVFFKLLG